MKASLEMINQKPYTKKWYSVFVTYQDGERSEQAKFKSPGDAWEYGKTLQDDHYQVPPTKIEVEC